MDLADKARKLERRISRTVDAALEEFMGRSATTPLEIVHAVLDRAESEIQEIGRGRRVFPFNRVRLQVMAGPRDKEARARFAAVADGPPSLSERLADRLRAAGCAVSTVATEILYVRRRGADWDDPDFHVEFDRADVAPTVPAPPAVVVDVSRQIKLTVLNGSAEHRVYAFSTGRIDIGRRAEVVDQRQRLIRTNHVAFLEEGPDANRSVSRRHAHIAFSDEDGCYRIWDDRSAHGTSIVRGGRTIKVPAGARGTKLESGDEIALGHARLRVIVESKKRKA
jgi:FHA domain-containing protein